MYYLKTTSFIMTAERKKKFQIVMGGESSRPVDGSEATPDVGMPLHDQFLLIYPF